MQKRIYHKKKKKKKIVSRNTWYFCCCMLIWLLLTGSLAAQSGLQKRADQAFQDMAFPEAIRLYQKVLKKDFDKTALIRLADSYRLTRKYESAAEYYGKVVALNQIPPINYFNYAQALMNNGMYREAEQWFLRYATQKPADPRGLKFAESCRNIDQFYADTAYYRVSNYRFNSPEDDFGPAWYRNGFLFASSRGDGDIIQKKYQWNDQPFLDVYFAPLGLEGEEEKRPRLLNGKLNSRFHEAGCSVDEKNGYIYFTRNNFFQGKKGQDASGVINLKLFYAKIGDRGWEELRSLPFNSDVHSVGHPAIDPTGEILYFISDMEGGHGGTDIYVSRRNGNGWSDPVNLGPVINTPGNEMFPYMHPNGLLYYASDGLGGLGGLDVFESAIPGDAAVPPRNVGAPVNSPFDDFGMIKSRDQLIGLFSSNRPGGKGGDDLYRYSLLQPGLNVLVLDEESGLPVPGAKMVAQIAGTAQQRQLLASDSGVVGMLLLPETSYRLRVSADGYQPVEEVFYTHGMLPGEIFRDTFYLPLPPVKVIARVLNGSTSDPVVNAKVRVLGKSLEYTTDSAGQFSFLANPYPDYRARVSECPDQEVPEYCFAFSDAGDMASDSSALMYEWNLGDGTRVRGLEVEHCYSNPGIYQIELNLIDTTSGFLFLTESSYELEVRPPKQVFISGPDSLSRGQQARFDGSDSYLADCNVRRYSWEVDGKVAGQGPVLNYTFREVGLHAVRLQVEGEGREAPRSCGQCVTKWIEVLPSGWQTSPKDSLREVWSELPPATAGADIKCSPQVPENYCFEFNDAGYSEGDTMAFVYEWDLGDGTRRRGRTVEHCYAHPGNYRVRLHIIDPFVKQSTVLQSDYMLEVKDLEQVYVESRDTVRTGTPLALDAFESEAPGCLVRSVLWEMGDGNTQAGPEVAYTYNRAGSYRVRLVLSGKTPTGERCEVCTYKQVTVVDGFIDRQPAGIVSNSNVIEDPVLDPEKIYFLELSKPGFKTKVIPYQVFDSSGVLLDSIFLEPITDEVAVDGTIRDSLGNALEEVTLRVLTPEGQEVKRLEVKAGKFTIGLNTGRSYVLSAEKTGFLSGQQSIGPLEQSQGVQPALRFTLEPVVVGKSMVLQNIYYDFDKANLRSESEGELKKVLSFLQANSGIRVELGSHTDARGGDDYNLWLSQKRAASAVNFLVEQGLNATRIVARGYGEQRPVNGCGNTVDCSEAAHQANRRTEITIIGYSDAAYKEALLVIGDDAVQELVADSLRFSIELGIFAEPMAPAHLPSEFPIRLLQQGNLYIYRSDVQGDYAAAQARLAHMQGMGFADAYIVSLDEGDASNPVVDSREMPALAGTDFYYTIQIAVLGRTTPASYFAPLAEYQEMLQVKTLNGLKKHSVFRVSSYKMARKFLGRVRARGYRDAFITVYENGKRISVEKGIEAERKQR